MTVTDRPLPDARPSEPERRRRGAAHPGGRPARPRPAPAARALTDAVDEADLVAQHSPPMPPRVWILAHVEMQEELCLVRTLGARGAGAPRHRRTRRRVQARPRRRPAPRPAPPPRSAPTSGRSGTRASMCWISVRAGIDAVAVAGGPRSASDALFSMSSSTTRRCSSIHQAAQRLRRVEVGLRHCSLLRAPVAARVLVPARPFTMGTDTRRGRWTMSDGRMPADVPLLPFHAAPSRRRAGTRGTPSPPGGDDHPRRPSQPAWTHRRSCRTRSRRSPGGATRRTSGPAPVAFVEPFRPRAGAPRRFFEARRTPPGRAAAAH